MLIFCCFSRLQNLSKVDRDPPAGWRVRSQTELHQSSRQFPQIDFIVADHAPKRKFLDAVGLSNEDLNPTTVHTFLDDLQDINPTTVHTFFR